MLQCNYRGLQLSQRIVPILPLFKSANVKSVRWTHRIPPAHNRGQGPPHKETAVKAVWNRLFGRYLLLTNTISSGILMMAGDIMSQELEYRRGTLTERYDMMRIGRMFLVGSLQGPLHHYFYNWMSRVMPANTIQTTVKKIFLDQVIMSPICILLFFYPACLLENKSLKESTEEIRSKFLTVYVTDWCVWPAAQFYNFHYLHPKYHVMFVNVMTMMYNIFLSYIKHHDGFGGESVEASKSS